MKAEEASVQEDQQTIYCRNLWSEVLIRAVRDWDICQCEDAKSWLLSDQTEPTSFLWVLREIGLGEMVEEIRKEIFSIPANSRRIRRRTSVR